MERHELDPASLVAGVIFTVLGIVFLLGGLSTLEVQLRWVWPVVLVLLGVSLLVGSHPVRNRWRAQDGADRDLT